MSSTTAPCSINGCKRAATCLCHHCKKNVCSKHFNEHQIQINNELVPFTDRLNELKMKLQIKENSNGALAMLKIWRDKKYKEIDQEYNRKVQELNRKISKQEEEVSKTIKKIEELIDEGEASLDQVKQLKKEIEIIENQVDILMTNDQTQISYEKNTPPKLNLVNTYVQLGGRKYFVKGKIFCEKENLYALECETSLSGYDGLCPMCRNVHVSLESNRGFYVLCKTLHQKLENNEKY